MLERNYKILLWLYIFWFLGSIILISLGILPSRITGVHSVFLIFTGVFATVFFIVQYGKGLGSAITILIFAVTTCIEWMQLSFAEDVYTASYGFMIKGVPVTFGFIWIGLIAGTHVIAREITLKVNIDWLRGGMYAVIAATMVMIFEIIVEPISIQAKQLPFLGNGLTILQFSDVANWFLLGLILHLMIYFILSLTNRWEHLKYPDLKSEIVVVYWIILAFFIFLSLYVDVWATITVGLTANLIFTICYYLSLDSKPRIRLKKPKT
ncbi:hypothetical protein X560_1948 [Listeria fleischmannii 1991]|uniref:DUF422 domain-containing protein n=4 Tax=Listeria fleischmannii TaxID=1069827 RepID=A0A2X3JD40_9LIST|nr:hypothetical protein [Listeria fleischmannii]EIA21260.1 hypothetical protein KKC_02339 [Listeria fleischmannii subsp. coloradonensis]EMG29270.1 hypothetical protein LFLEISCH_01435 [Listeria fleischmannii subsp. fleischmannii LU2006-1]EUJ43187.1 hypothetical protein MCOL2_20638 [Listeria fleischmannii FSL S10-1203]KMT58732.1 hypothetical protein X560_1948 [Listeria fleischmannii 1991]MBC1398823.1 DUF422 domain-containing protein [Listeria fleischmannii]